MYKKIIKVSIYDITLSHVNPGYRLWYSRFSHFFAFLLIWVEHIPRATLYTQGLFQIKVWIS